MRFGVLLIDALSGFDECRIGNEYSCCDVVGFVVYSSSFVGYSIQRTGAHRRRGGHKIEEHTRGYSFKYENVIQSGIGPWPELFANLTRPIESNCRAAAGGGGTTEERYKLCPHNYCRSAGGGGGGIKLQCIQCFNLPQVISISFIHGLLSSSQPASSTDWVPVAMLMGSNRSL